MVNHLDPIARRSAHRRVVGFLILHIMEKKQTAMTPKEKAIQIKCYCGHTIYCDCGPLEEPTNDMIDHIGDANKMVEISDEELFQQAIKAMEEHYGSGCDSEIDAYFRGAKWMQKQLKTNN